MWPSLRLTENSVSYEGLCMLQLHVTYYNNMLHVTCCMLHVTCCLLHVTCYCYMLHVNVTCYSYMLHVTCCMLHVTCCMLHVTCYSCMLHVTCCILHVTCCMLHVTVICYMLHVKILLILMNSELVNCCSLRIADGDVVDQPLEVYFSSVSFLPFTLKYILFVLSGKIRIFLSIRDHYLNSKYLLTFCNFFLMKIFNLLNIKRLR